MSEEINLSVVINTKNSAKYLAACLASVEKIADEIVIVDMKSTDETLAIARRFGAKIHQFPEPEIGFVEAAREYLFARAQGKWLLLLDSDEMLTENLAQQIAILTQEAGDPQVYFIARQNIIFGRPLLATGWYPDYQARLWQRGALTWPAEIHSVPKIHGPSANLPAKAEFSIIHQNYQTVSDFITRANRYTDIQAQQESKPKNYHASQFTQTFFNEWLQRFFALEGYRDGNHGALLSLFQAHYELTVVAKQWQELDFPAQQLSSTELTDLMKDLQRQLRYWLADYQVKNSHGLKKLWARCQRKLAS